MHPASKTLAREMRAIRTSFSRLAQSFARITPLLAAPATTAGAAVSAPSSRRRPRLTADHRRALKLQGKYMGTMRGLKAAQRARVKKVRAEKGIKAAIAEAVRLAG